jgi:hypothetical protein
MRLDVEVEAATITFQSVADIMESRHIYNKVNLPFIKDKVTIVF